MLENVVLKASLQRLLCLRSHLLDQLFTSFREKLEKMLSICGGNHSVLSGRDYAVGIDLTKKHVVFSVHFKFFGYLMFKDALA